jgi:hypothetical protein
MPMRNTLSLGHQRIRASGPPSQTKRNDVEVPSKSGLPNMTVSSLLRSNHEIHYKDPVTIQP